MRTSTLSTLVFSASLASGAVATTWHGVLPRALMARQDQSFQPGVDQGQGSTCKEAFGGGSRLCADSDVCYDPTEGDLCCSEGYPCPSGSFCLTKGYCCPDGVDPKTCAADNNVELPADFGKTTKPAAPTETTASEQVTATPSTTPPFPIPGKTTATAPAPTGTGLTPSVYTTSSSFSPSSTLTPFTGAASSLNIGSGLLVALFAVAGIMAAC